MSEKTIINPDFIIIGGGINSYLLSILLTKEKYSVLLFENHDDNGTKEVEQYHYVPLNFLKIHSIPYSEQSFQNKSFDAYIERFVRLEKYFIPKIAKPKNDIDWLVYNTKQMGVINEMKFLKLIISLMSKSEKLQTIALDETFSVKTDNQTDSNKYQINFQTNSVTIAKQKVIFTDSCVERYFGQSLVSESGKVHKYTFKIQDVLSDSINHYFFKNSEDLEFLSIIPCNSFTIVECTSEKEMSESLLTFITNFMENKFEIRKEDLIILNEEYKFKTINFMKPNSFIVLPDKQMSSFSFMGTFLNNLKSVFYLSYCLENNLITTFLKWQELSLTGFNIINEFFFGNKKEQNFQKFGKLVRNKDLSNINIISKQFINIRFNTLFKKQGMTSKERNMFFEILTQAIDYKNKNS